MSMEMGTTTSPAGRTCPQCGGLIPQQKRGRPRKYCSQSCRQDAYEKRNGLPSWRAERQARESASKVERAYRRTEYERARRLTRLSTSQRHDIHEQLEACLDAVCSDELAMAEVLEVVSCIVLDDLLSKTTKSEHLGRAIEQLVSDVRLVGFRATPPEFPKP